VLEDESCWRKRSHRRGRGNVSTEGSKVSFDVRAQAFDVLREEIDAQAGSA